MGVPGSVTILNVDGIPPIPDPILPITEGLGLVLVTERRLDWVITLVNRTLNSFNAARLSEEGERRGRQGSDR